MPAVPFRRALTALVQRATQRLGAGHLEELYQRNYLHLARETEWVVETPLASPSGGTASFSFLYLLLNMLRDPGITSVLEFGAGQSTRLLAQFAESRVGEVTTIESSARWLEIATAGIDASNFRRIHAPLAEKEIVGRHVPWYDCPKPERAVDLVIIDGPAAITRSSRYARLGCIDWFPSIVKEEYLVLIDDTNRRAERVLADALEEVLLSTRPQCFRRDYVGSASQTVLTSESFRGYVHL